MMKKRIIALLTGIIIVSCGFVVHLAAVADNTIDVLAETYVKGETLVIPDSVKADSKTYNLENVNVVAPDGKQYSEKSLVLRRMGIYTVEYDAINGTTTKHCKETFMTKSNKYSISGSGSYEWKANEKTPNTEGLNVKLGVGSTFTYNKIIDLNNLAPTDDLVNLYAVPNVIGRPDFFEVLITMTDLYDSTNKVKIAGRNVRDGEQQGSWGEGEYEYSRYTCYFQGGSTAQPLSGYKFGNKTGEFFVNGTYGYSSTCSFCGLGVGSKSMDTDRFTVSFDYRERQVLKDGKVVVDLDDPADFTELWGGFTTGEVILSINLNNAGTIVITDIANERLDSELLFLDSEAPTITVDYKGYENNIPSAMLGMAYSIFDATAIDTYSGALNVSRNVYYDYNSTKEPITLTNNSFTPTKAGTYTVEYKSTDWCGNVGVVTYDVEVAGRGTPITASIVSSTKVTSGFTGNKIPIADINTSGGYGRLSTQTKCYAPSGEEVEIKGGGFYALSVGNYKVEYVTTDYIGQSKTLKYEVSVSLSSEPAIVDEVILPKYFISGKKYVLPSLQGYVFYSDSTIKADTDIYVKDSESERKLTDNVYYPSVNSNGTPIEIIYKLKANGKTVEKRYAASGYVTTDLDGKLDLKRCFIYNDSSVTAAATDNYLSYETVLSGEKLSFVNPLLADGFSLRLNLAGMARANVWTLTLTDYDNPDVRLSAKFIKNQGVCSLTLNDEKVYDDIKYIYFGNDAAVYIKFNNVHGKFGVSDGEKDVWYKPTDEDGIYFNSGKVYLDIEFTDIEGKCTLRLMELNSQKLKYMTSDLLKPAVSIFTDVVGLKYKIGDIALVSRATGLDVLEPYAETTLTVRDADRTVVTDINGVKLENVPCDVDYRFVITGYGNYTVTYTVKDASNNGGFSSGGFSYIISAVDVIKPNLVLEYRIVSEASIGSTIYVPNAYGEDNVSAVANIKVNYYVITSDGILHNFNRSVYDSFKANYEGTYIIRYTLSDEAGNMLITDFKINVR